MLEGIYAEIHSSIMHIHLTNKVNTHSILGMVLDAAETLTNKGPSSLPL
jgi:hypothetical protein